MRCEIVICHNHNFTTSQFHFTTLIKVSFWAKDPSNEEYDFTEGGESKYHVMSNGELIEPEEVKKCERISKKNQRKVKNGSQERKLVVGHKENEFGFSINKLEIFKFPESQENRE